MQIFDEQFIITGNDTEDLRLINHTTTLENAIRILQEGITSNIPTIEESGVSELKTHIVWTSPNEWKNEESPFGGISFDIEWRNISAGFNRVYKVEDEGLMRNYDNPTYRLLFTNSVYDNESIVKLFNPKLDKGPIKSVNKKWYKKSTNFLVGHFLLETSVVSMDKISRIKFVKHTKDATMNRYECGSAFLSYILFKGLKNVNHLFKVDGVYDENLVSYLSYIKTHKFDNLPPNRKGLAGNTESLIRRFLKYYYLSVSEPRRSEEYDRRIHKILSSIGGREECTKAFCSYVSRHFDYNFK